MLVIIILVILEFTVIVTVISKLIMESCIPLLDSHTVIRSACITVFVTIISRSRPIFRFPVGMLHYSVEVRPTGRPTHLAGTEEMSPVLDSEPECVPADHS